MIFMKNEVDLAKRFDTIRSVGRHRATQRVVGQGNPGSGYRDSGRRIAKAMRILLQQKNTGLYLKDSGVWIHGAAEATDFLSSTKAIAYCASKKLSGVQIVLKFDEQHYDIVLPMLNWRRDQTSMKGLMA